MCKWQSVSTTSMLNPALTAERTGYTGIPAGPEITFITSDNASTGYNPIIDLATETETPLHRWKANTLLVDGEGKLVAPSEANKALKQVWEILEGALEHSTDRNEELDSSVSLYSFFESWCDWAFQRGDMTRREVELVLGMSQMWGAYVGDRIELQSLKYFYLEDCIGGGRHEDRLLAVCN